MRNNAPMWLRLLVTVFAFTLRAAACVSTDAAAFTEPLAAALDIVERVPPTPNEPILVVGVGRLGQLICRALAASGARVVAVGRSSEKIARLAGVVESAARHGIWCQQQRLVRWA